MFLGLADTIVGLYVFFCDVGILRCLVNLLYYVLS